MVAYRGKIVYIIGVIIFALIVIVAVKEWYNTVFYIRDNILIYEKGIFTKSKQEIPFDKINTIDLGKNLLDRIFDVCTLKIDSGSAVKEETEFKIRVKCEIAEKLRETILNVEKNVVNENSEEENREDNIEKTITIKELVIYAATKGKLGWAIGGFFAVINFADNIEDFTKTSVIKNLLENININDVMINNTAVMIFSIIAMVILLYIIITILSIAFEIIRLYKFSIKAKDKNLKISYGMISKKEYSIPIEKIHALRYKQSIFQSLLGIYTLEAVTIGYGDEKDEKAILYPIANDKFKNEFLGKLLPEMDFLGKIEKPYKSSLKRFIFMRSLIVSAILLLLYFTIKVVPIEIKLAAIIIIFLVNFGLGYLNYKNTSLGVSEKNIISSCGSLTKTTTIIKQSSVQSIEKVQNPFQRKDMVCDYKINIYSNQFGEKVKVRHMSENINSALYENLIL
jgi:putative membrane protein